MNHNLNTKTICLVGYGNFYYVAQKLSQSYGRVLYYLPYETAFPKYNQYIVGMGIEGVERIYNIWDYYDSIDIFYFEDLFQGSFQQWLRGQNKIVFGAGKGEDMEIYRDRFKDLQKELGMPLNNHVVKKGIDALTEHLKYKQDVFVKTNIMRGNMETFHWDNYDLSKPILDELQHSLGAYKNEIIFIVEDPIKDALEYGFDGFTIDGKYPDKTFFGCEIKDAAYACQFTDYENLPTPVKEANEKLSPVFASYNYRGSYSNEMRATDKRTAVLTDMTCFSADTEVLTDNGWKFFYDLNDTDKICTLHPDTNKIEYHKPYNYISYFHKGDMINISNKAKSIDSLVTPNHSVWRTDRHGNGLYEERADSLKDKGYIPRTGIWDAPEMEYFELPEYSNEWTNIGKDGQSLNREYCKTAIHIKADYWFAFMGWYLSEGNLGGYNKSQVHITQSKYVSKVHEVLEDLGFDYTFSGKDFQINSKQLANYLSKYGICNEKYVPDYIKSASIRQINIFLDNFRLGDGSSFPIYNNRIRKLYYSTSKRMIDDIQELILKIGSVGNIRPNGIKGSDTGFKSKKGGTYKRNHNGYKIEENISRKRFWFETSPACNNIKSVPYEGFVYDVTVKNHILYVRRNGKPLWSGNCRNPEPPTSLMIEMMEDYGMYVWQVANGIVPKIKSKGLYGVMLVIKSDWARTEPQAIYFPEQVKDFVKIKSPAIIDGVLYSIPQTCEMQELGSVIAYDNTLKGAIEKAKAISQEIKGYCVKCNADHLDAAQDALSQLPKYGFKG